MSMHIEHAALTTTGKKKGKEKWKSAAAKQQSQSLKDSWQKLLLDHKVSLQAHNKPVKGYVPPEVVRRATTAIASKKDEWQACTKTPDKVYTGDAMLGIAVLHKSNVVPVFSEEDAIAISNMRR